MKKLICPYCGKVDSPLIRHFAYPHLDFAYNTFRDSDDWYDILLEYKDEDGKAAVYCCYCKHEGDISTFEVEEPIKGNFEIMIPFMEDGRPKIAYFKCRDYKEFQDKIKRMAQCDFKYVDMIKANPMCRVYNYPLAWDGIPLIEIMEWRDDKN
jgi:hypothetical protein